MSLGNAFDITNNYTICCKELIITGTSSTSGTLFVNGGISTNGIFTTTDKILCTCTDNSTSYTTGCVIVSGGVGITKDVYMNQNLRVEGDITCGSIIYEETETITSDIDSTSPTTGASIIVGGCGVGKRLNVGGDTKIYSTTQSTSATTGSFIVDGGCGIAKDLYVGGAIYGNLAGGIQTLTTESTSTSTGSLIINGGMGIAKNTNIGGTLSCPSEVITQMIISTDYTTGALIVSGGVGIGNNTNMLGNLSVGGSSTLKSVIVNSTVESISTSTGSVLIGGGLGIAKNTNIGGKLNILDTTLANATSGALVVGGGLSVGTNLYVNSGIRADSSSLLYGLTVVGQLQNVGNNIINGTETIDGITYLNNTTNSVGTGSGALQVAGGASITKDLYVGGNTFSSNNTIQNMPHGFENTTDSVIVYNPTTQIFTISPSFASFNVWIAGQRYTYTTPQLITHTNSPSTYYFYFDATGFHSSISMPSFYTSSLCSIVTYLGSGLGFACEERHSCIMSPATHLELHQQVGTYLVSGGVIGDYSLQPTTPTDAGNRFTLTASVISDEGLNSSLLALTAGTYYNVNKLTGSDAKWTYNTISVPFNYTTTGYIEYNNFTGGAWASTPATNNTYVNYYVVLVPSIYTATQIFLKPSNSVYSTLQSAQAETYASLTTSSYAPIEYVPIYQITFKTLSSYTTLGKCRIEAVTKIIGNKATITMNSQINNHNSLLGLEYANTGVSWGHINDTTQSIYGIKTFANTSASTSNTSGALIVSGGVGANGSIYAKNFWASNTGTPASQTNLMYQAYDTQNTFIQNNIQNLSNGTSASCDYIATCDTGTASTGYIDIGINGSGFTGTYGGKCDGYLYVIGGSSGGNGNLYIGTQTNNMKTYFTNGSTNVNMMSVASNGVNVLSTTQSTSTTTGSLIISGGVGIAGNLNVGGTVNFGYVSYMWVLSDVKTSGTVSGTFTSGANRTRTLNTITGDTSNTAVTLNTSTSQFTITAGKYHVAIKAPAYRVRQNVASLYNVTDDTYIYGQATDCEEVAGNETFAFVDTLINIATTKVYEVRHQCLYTYVTLGFGISCGFSGISEVYTTVVITKL